MWFLGSVLRNNYQPNLDQNKYKTAEKPARGLTEHHMVEQIVHMMLNSQNDNRINIFLHFKIELGYARLGLKYDELVTSWRLEAFNIKLINNYDIYCLNASNY